MPNHYQFPVGRAFRADADGASFVAQQLQYISPNILKTVFAEPEWQKHLPLETGNFPWAAEMGYDVFTAAGMAEVFEGDGWNLPEVGVNRERIISRVFPIGLNRSLSDSDVEQAAMEYRQMRAMYPQMQDVITIDKALEEAQAQGVAMKHNDIVLNGLPANNILGLFAQPNVSNYPAPVGAGGSALWENKTGEEMVADLTALISLVMTTAKVADFYPDRLVLPLNKYLALSTRHMVGTGMTALSFFQKENPLGNRLQVNSWQALNGRGSGGTGWAMAYKYDENVISYRAPLVYHVHMPPARGPAGWTWTHSGRSAGVAVKRPFAVATMQGF